MGKSKKKEKKKSFLSDDEEPPVVIPDGEEDEEEEVVALPKLSKKQAKKKNAKPVPVVEASDEDGDGDSDEIEVNTNGKLAGKPSGKAAGRKPTGFAALMEQSDSDDDRADYPASKSKGGFSALMMDSDGDYDRDDDDDDNDGETVSRSKHTSNKDKDATSKKKDKKKGKEKKKKKKDQDFDDDADLEKMLSELSVEYSGPKTEQQEPSADDKPLEQSKVTKPTNDLPVSADAPTDDLAEAASNDKAREVQEEGDTALRTKAQKRKEKKDRQKKAAQVETPPLETAAPQDSAKVLIEDDNNLKTGKSKKKKKVEDKVKVEEDTTVEDDSKSKKKGPSKRIVAAMQEAMRKQQEAEEKAQREQEERIRREEEEERRQKEEAIRIQEMKELKKKQAKERRDQLKAEGKLLTPKQKQAQAKAQAMLEAMRRQGIQVGQQKPKLSAKDARRHRKKHLTGAEESKEPTVADDRTEKHDEEKPTQVETEEVGDTTEPVATEDDVMESWEDGVKDSWDQDSDQDEIDQSTNTTNAKTDNTESSNTTEQKQAINNNDSAKAAPSEDSESSGSESSESSDESDGDQRTEAQRQRDKVLHRIERRRETARANMSSDCLREPVICVLGHVDTGKTKILDKLRRTNVQEGEAGGITQQIGATNVPLKSIEEQHRLVRVHKVDELKIPGLLIIDTPGHESFSNLRSRGSSLCDLAILVVDIMHGLEPQTIESINLLKQKRTPFVVALNKVDRLYDWETGRGRDIQDIIAAQQSNTRLEFEQRWQQVQTQLAEQGLNARLFYDNPNAREYLSVVPTSAITGEGMANLMALVVLLTQNMLRRRLMYSDELQATVLEVKQIAGLGTTIDVILVNGTLREGSTIVLAGTDGPIVTQIRSLLMPQPLRELRVKNAYREFSEVRAAQGVKIAAKDLEHAIAGLNLLVAERPDEVDVCRALVNSELRTALRSIRLKERGVHVQASTLGSLEALIEFLRVSKISYSGVRIGPVVKRDVMRVSAQLEHDVEFACILAFDVRVERDAQELADQMSVRIFQADIIYHLFDKFTAYKEELRQQRREQFRNTAVFPCRLRVLPQYIFNSRDPIVIGVSVDAGIVKIGTPICVPTKEFLDIGYVSSLEVNHKQVEEARKGAEVCIKIEPIPGDSPKMYGRHFDEKDFLVSRISRESIDACKNHFREDLLKSDWQLMIELKKSFKII